MKDLVIGDVHFGVKANSVFWLESQKKLFEEQIFPAINEKAVDRIIFLGDLFDIRYALNQQVGIEVKNLIRNLCKLTDKPIIFLAGNHDYYSPLEEFTNYNSYELLFGEEFIKCHPNIILIDKEPKLMDGALFLPWYYTENPEHFDDFLYQFHFGDEVKCIYCHADLGVWPGARVTSLKGVPVFSGHIHNVTEYEYGNLHNVGSVLPMTFNDVNEYRYFYIIENYRITERVQNITTPLFKRIYNDDIFTVTGEDINNAYMQICISSSNINKANYVDQIKYVTTTYTGGNVRIHVVPDEENEKVRFSGEGFNTNITEYITSNVPQHLLPKYEYVKKKIEGHK